MLETKKNNEERLSGKLTGGKLIVNAVLAKEGVTDPTQEQSDKELDIIEEEHHVIIFMYKVDKYKYGKLLEQMENDMIQKKKVPFPETIGEACDILGWKNQYRGRDNHIYDTNDGIAFAMTGSEERKHNNKKKEITCYKCNKMGHYANECDDEATVKTSNVLDKNGSNFLVMK